MTPEPNSPAGLPSHAEAPAIMDRARRMRAEALAALVRAAWSRFAGRPRGVPAASMSGRMPYAGA